MKSIRSLIKKKLDFRLRLCIKPKKKIVAILSVLKELLLLPDLTLHASLHLVGAICEGTQRTWLFPQDFELLGLCLSTQAPWKGEILYMSLSFFVLVFLFGSVLVFLACFCSLVSFCFPLY